MTLPKVVICGDIVWAHEELQQMLGSVAEIVLMDSPNRKDFFDNLASNCKYGNVVGFYRHNSSADRIGIFDKELVNALPDTCKWIAHNGAGYDQIDIAACKARGIRVSNTPGAVDEGTATTALYLLLSALRQFSIAERNLRSLQWKSGLIPAHDPSAMTLGILGMGGIGLHFAKMAQALPVKKILYHNRSPKKDAPEWCEYVPTLEGLLSRVDVLSVHCPLNERTVGLVGEKQIRTLKKGAIIINTARGKVIDEEALIRALDDGHLYAAGLDVYPDEPNVNPKLMEYRNVTLLPHMGTETQESQRAMEVRALQNLQDYFASGHGKDLVLEYRT